MSSVRYFSEIAHENHKKLIEVIEKFPPLGKKRKTMIGGEKAATVRPEIPKYEEELTKLSFITVIFSNIALESYIYDYAARHLGDSFVKDYLDKLDTLSKWVVIPKLITGRELSRRQHWYGLLKQLIKTRNAITHHKSLDLPSPPAYDLIKKQDQSSSELHEAAIQSIPLLRILADKISENDPEEAPWVQAYLS
jgi:hypothetical protein